MTTSAFKVHGLDCAEEVALLKAELGPLPGVAELSFDVLRGKMIVTHHGDTASQESLIAAVSRTGLRAEPWQAEENRPPRQFDLWGDRRTITAAVSGALLTSGFFVHGMIAGWGETFSDAAPPLASRTLYLVATVAGAWFILPKAARALARLRPDMNLLMVVAVCGAIALGEYQEAATVSFLFALSLALEGWSVGRARRAIQSLMSLTPQQARVLEAGQETLREAREVAAGSRILIRPSEKIPLDGHIVEGATTIDQAPITGESTPVDKRIGDEVFAGTINLDGAIQVETTKAADDTTLARIIRLVGDAQSKRSPSEQWVERFAQVYTPAVMIAALAIILLPPLLAGGAWSTWIYRGLVLLVIACPCALVISTPVSIVAAIACAARRGVLVKGGPFIEAPAKLRAIAFDKTGTLTVGRPEVREIVPLAGHTREELLGIAASIEAHTTHPLGVAIVLAAQQQGLQVTPAADFRALAGKGATATLNGRTAWVGSYRMLEEQGRGNPEVQRIAGELEQRGMSLVAVGEDQHVCGLIALADAIRPESKQVLRELRELGLEQIVMLTGDHRSAAESVAAEIGVDVVRADLLPEEKVTAIEQLVASRQLVAMIGDGVNDAPALARATLGIAMGAAGTDAALETADIALMGDDLTAIPWLVRHARRTLTVIRQNILASLGVKAAFVLLTLVGYASLWSAIAADTGMSLLVVLNGLRLLRDRE